MKAAKHGFDLDGLGGIGGGVLVGGDLWGDALVGTAEVDVVPVLTAETAKLGAIEEEDVVEELATEAAGEAPR